MRVVYGCDYSLLAGFPLEYCGGEAACAGVSSVITDTSSSTARPKSSEIKTIEHLYKTKTTEELFYNTSKYDKMKVKQLILL